MTETAMGRLVAYIMHPPWAKWLHRFLLTGGYAIMIVAGVAATQLGIPAMQAGYVVIAGSIVSLIGVWTRYFRVEAIGLWPQITGLLTCVIWLQIPPQSAILSGWLVAAYCFFLGLRLVELNVISWRMTAGGDSP